VGRPALSGKYASVQRRKKLVGGGRPPPVTAANSTKPAAAAKRPGRKPSNSKTADSGGTAGRPAASVTRTNSQDDDPTLAEHQLRDGLRVLARMDGGHFYPGRLNAVRPPDIYGILLDNERGFRPVIYAREELLKAGLEKTRVKKKKKKQPSGFFVFFIYLPRRESF
jgi:hypothetical protein